MPPNFTITKSQFTPNTLTLGVERQILGVKIRTLFNHVWHAYCKGLDAAFSKHDTQHSTLSYIDLNWEYPECGV